ncbi:MAG: PH domain-containing protein [Coriobacteriales bacterium]|jgi:membrane protein YdbS with pleckstrin-like domain|nr:PH domain-containing protein [Coriobacteriales bacterium]
MQRRKLDRKVVTVWTLAAVINVVLWCLLAALCCVFVCAVTSVGRSLLAHGVAWLAGRGIFLCIIVCVVLLVICAAIMPRFRWRRFSFAVGEEYLEIYRGIFWRKHFVVPLIRVQDVDTHQGPLMRSFGLASFSAATAAGKHEIPGLPIAEADQLRSQVAELAREAREQDV